MLLGATEGVMHNPAPLDAPSGDAHSLCAKPTTDAFKHRQMRSCPLSPVFPARSRAFLVSARSTLQSIAKSSISRIACVDDESVSITSISWVCRLAVT